MLAFMRERVHLVPQKDRAMFSPEITVRMKDGTTYAREYPYARMEWTLDPLQARLTDCFHEPGKRRRRFDALAAVVRELEARASMAGLVSAASVDLSTDAG